MPMTKNALARMIAAAGSKWILAPLAVCSLAMAACQSDKHPMVEAKPGMTVICTACYDETVRLSHGSKFRSSAMKQTTHQCPSCRTQMSTYVENGVDKIRCAVCAPDGVECDKCLPLDRVTK